MIVATVRTYGGALTCEVRGATRIDALKQVCDWLDAIGRADERVEITFRKENRDADVPSVS